tara:strand:- start:1484 stop:2467 length:984 start_codon:yes stop_codon:yes gene_type:complete
MAAGVTIKVKRKTTAFTSGELVAGEFGLDTVTGILYSSIDGASVFEVNPAVGENDAITKAITSDTSHGLTVNSPVRPSGVVWVDALADTVDNAESFGIITSVEASDAYTVTLSGYTDTVTGMVADTLYYLDPTTAGTLTTTKPTILGQVAKPMFWATSTTAGYVLNMRGEEVTANEAFSGQQAIQQVVQEYDVAAAQNLTTTHADIDGSDNSFTPVSASSVIKYEFTFHAATQVAGENLRAYFKLMVNGVMETESGTAIYLNGVNADIEVHYAYLVQSWGTSAQIMKLQGREHSAATDSKVHATYSWDGTAPSTVLVRPLLTITEYL